MIGDDWRAARPTVAGLHLDSAACSRQSVAVIEATAQHARHKAEVGGYVAAEAAVPALDAGRAAIGALTGLAATDVIYTTGATAALDQLLSSWTGERTIACLSGEYGPNLAVMAANGFGVQPLPVDRDGRIEVDVAADQLSANRPALVHLTALGSHRGVAQPLGDVATICRDLGLPLVIDAAQALGHLDCAVAPAAIYSSSRKWIAGPRGVGFLAVAPELATRLQLRIPPPDWGLPIPVLAGLEQGEANVAARIGYSVALGEHLAAGPHMLRQRLADVGRFSREALADVDGWRVVESTDEPTAITTLEPPGGVDPSQVRAWLIAERGIVTTCAGVERAPFELAGPVLRVSPHVDATPDELAQFGRALADFANQ